MASGKSDEQRFTEYLDKIIAGEEFIIDEDISDELRDAIEFSRRLYTGQESPSPDFQQRLWNRLRYKINNPETQIEEPEGIFTRIINSLSQRRLALQIAAGTAAALLIILVGVVWYNASTSQEMMTASAPAEPTVPTATPGERTADLPKNTLAAPVTFYLNTSLSTDNRQAPVYQISELDINQNYVAELGQKLGFTGAPVSMDGGLKIVMTDSSMDSPRQLTVWTASGAIEYGYTSPDKLYPAYTAMLPSPDEAKVLAYDFLDKLDLLPPDYQNFGVIKDRIVVAAGGGYDIEEGAVGNIMQKDPSYWLVKFPFNVDGNPVTGPGAKTEVSIGDEGEPVSMVWAWKEVTPAYTENIKSEQSAFDDIVNNKGTVDMPVSCPNVRIDDVQLSYWIDPLSEKQDYILPVYVFKGDCLDDNGHYIEGFTAWTDATLPAD
jgi:hypothetical protein